jgi:hypothetical protein
VQLRGFEPLALPAEIGADLRRMVLHVVARSVRVLRICVGVLRDVTVLGQGSKGSCPNIEPDRLGAGRFQRKVLVPTDQEAIAEDSANH